MEKEGLDVRAIVRRTEGAPLPIFCIIDWSESRRQLVVQLDAWSSAGPELEYAPNSILAIASPEPTDVLLVVVYRHWASVSWERDSKLDRSSLRRTTCGGEECRGRSPIAFAQ
ncbi:hypothetical protein GCM10017691_63730 [Pseudonocardia petroleophila]